MRRRGWAEARVGAGERGASVSSGMAAAVERARARHHGREFSLGRRRTSGVTSVSTAPQPRSF